MDLTFQEKSIIGSLTITIALFGNYFFKAFKVFMSDSSEAAIGLSFVLVGTVIAIIVVEVVYHIVIALASKPEGEDERGRLIEAKATRIAYFVLASGCVITVGHTLIAVFVDELLAERVIQTPILTANMIVFSFILAEIVGFGMQLYYYRRGI